MTHFRIAWLLALVVTTVACRPESWYKSEIETIDRVLLSLDSAIYNLTQIDTLPYAERNRGFKDRMGFIESWYTQRGDTMNREVAMLVAQYREVRKPLANFRTEYYRVEGELLYTRSQLANLKQDLSYNLLHTQVVKRVFTEELTAADKVMADAKRLDVSNMLTKRKLLDTEPKVDSLIQVLKSTK
jgi:hypothetical protein